MDKKFKKRPSIICFIQELEDLLFTVKKFSDDIGMKFRLEKYVKARFREGKSRCANAVELDIDTAIHELDQNETYK